MTWKLQAAHLCMWHYQAVIIIGAELDPVMLGGSRVQLTAACAMPEHLPRLTPCCRGLTTGLQLALRTCVDADADAATAWDFGRANGKRTSI
jgi:hypothetical protein